MKNGTIKTHKEIHTTNKASEIIHIETKKHKQRTKTSGRTTTTQGRNQNEEYKNTYGQKNTERIKTKQQREEQNKKN